MKDGFRIVTFLFLLGLLDPFQGNAEQAYLRKIRIVSEGKLQERDEVRAEKGLQEFVELEGPDAPLRHKKVAIGNIVVVRPGANLLMKYHDLAGVYGETQQEVS